MTVQPTATATAPAIRRRWSTARTALTTAGLGAVLVALTACGPASASGGAASTAPTTASTPAAAATPMPGVPFSGETTPTTTTPVTTGPVTSDPSGFMDMDTNLPAGGDVDQQFVDANGDHVSVSRNTGGGSSTVSNSSCDDTGCQSQIVANN